MGAIVTILVSLAVPTYFLQFLFAAGIMGGMWIFERAKREMFVKILCAWKSGDKEKLEVLTAEFKKEISEDVEMDSLCRDLMSKIGKGEIVYLYL